MAAEIAQQPSALSQLLERGAAEIRLIRRAVLYRGFRFVLIAARGTSDHVALYTKYLAEVKLGFPAGLASLSTATLYDAPLCFEDVLVVAISQSGGSPDLVEFTERARRDGALTVAITNSTSSPLADAAEHVIDIKAGEEHAVAATKTYTCQLLASYLFITGDERQAAEVPTVAERTLALSEHAHAAAERYRFAERLLTVGRGYSYPTACEAALKLMETSYLPAHAFSAADLMHGPVAMVDRDVPVIATGSAGAGARALEPVLERLRGAGADVLGIGAPDGLPLPAHELPEELLPIIEILPLQELAWRLAIDRGCDPDQPRGLQKVTHTR